MYVRGTTVSDTGPRILRFPIFYGSVIDIDYVFECSWGGRLPHGLTEPAGDDSDTTRALME